MSMSRFFLICSLAMLIICTAKASLQVTVEGVNGGSVMLPCFLNGNELQFQNINVCWRHNDSLNVYDITGGRDSMGSIFLHKKRAESFPKEYEKGNFSLKLNNLTHTDGGEYKCYIVHSSKLVTVQLLMKQSTEIKEKQAEETNLTWMILSVLWSFMLLYIFITFKKMKNDETSSSEMSDPEDPQVIASILWSVY